MALMAQLKARGHPDTGNGSYREAMVETWGQVPEYTGRGRPPRHKQAQHDWHYLQVVKHRSGNSVRGVTVKVVYGDPEEVRALLGEHTACVERTHLTSRQMNGRLVRKSLSFSKEREMLEASCAWEDWVYNLTRPLKALRVEVNGGRRRWQPRGFNGLVKLICYNVEVILQSHPYVFALSPSYSSQPISLVSLCLDLVSPFFNSRLF